MLAQLDNMFLETFFGFENVKLDVTPVVLLVFKSYVKSYFGGKTQKMKSSTLLHRVLQLVLFVEKIEISLWWSCAFLLTNFL